MGDAGRAEFNPRQIITKADRQCSMLNDGTPQRCPGANLWNLWMLSYSDKRASANEMRLKILGGHHPGFFRWDLNPMASAFARERQRLIWSMCIFDKVIQRRGRVKWKKEKKKEDKKRKPNNAHRHQKLWERRKDRPLKPPSWAWLASWFRLLASRTGKEQIPVI